MRLLNKKFIFVGGKGGVGKSTTAAALALKFAKEGTNTLLISTDPAHNIGDIFGQAIGGKKTALMDNLSAVEIDPERETKLYMKRVKENMQGIIHGAMMEEVNRQLDTAQVSPGADEAALFEKLISILIEEKDRFDKLIFDTAPTGHTIRLLSLPELMGIWIEGLLEKRRKINKNYSQLLHDGDPIEDPIYDVLKQRQERFSKARTLLLDSSNCSLLFVLNPERLAIVETERTVAVLEKYQLTVDAIIVNKVLPEAADGAFFAERRRLESKYITMIKHSFIHQQCIYVPLFPHDIIELEQLMKISNFL